MLTVAVGITDAKWVVQAIGEARAQENVLWIEVVRRGFPRGRGLGCVLKGRQVW